MNLSVLGEEGFLELVRDWIGDPADPVALGPGDDAALIDLGGNLHLAVSTDAYREGVHFRRDYLKPDEIGQRVMAATLSDLAAMGADPVAVLVNLHVPPDTSVLELRGIYLGLTRVADAYGVKLAGGDTVRATEIALGLTAIGTVAKGEALLRSGAREDDVICVSGTLGKSEAGRLLLAGAVEPPSGEELPPSLRRDAENAHRFPRPRFDVVRMLTGLERRTVDLELATETRQRVLPSALMDVSDGLAADVRRLCNASAVGCRIEERLVPVDEAARRISRLRREPEVTLALGGGEDFELLFTMHPEDTELLLKSARAGGIRVTAIGSILPASEGLWIERENGSRGSLPDAGFDHFLDRGSAPTGVDA